MEDKILEKTEQSIEKILKEGLNTNNLEHLYKLSKIRHMVKEDSQMMYGNYGRRPGHDSYGEYNDYGRRGYDMKYRGHNHIDRMYDGYGRYEEGRRSYNEGNYGAKEDTLRSLEYMLESMVDFVEMLKSEANSQEEINLIRKYTTKISQM